jgi:tetratricopeptide (TPR) repeat protein
MAALWAGRTALAREAAARALRFRDRLGERDRQLLAAWGLGLAGESAQAERIYRDLLLLYPDDPEANFQLGDLLHRANPLRGRSRAEALPPLRRALAVDPRNGCARCLLMWLELGVGEPGVADTLVHGFDPRQPFMERVIAAGAAGRRGDVAAQRAALRRLAGVGDAEVLLSALWATGRGVDAGYQGRLLALTTHEGRDRGVRTIGELALVHDALRHGRVAAADAALTRLAGLDPATARVNRALLTAHPVALFAGRRDDAPTALAEALAADSALAVASPPFVQPDSATLPWMRHYVRALAAMAAGHPVPPAPTDRPSTAGRVARWVRAEIAARQALRRGAAGEALGIVESAGDWFPGAQGDYSPMLALAPSRYLRGELLVEAGRDAEAAAWYRTIGEFPVWDWAYLAPAALRLGEIAERAGARREAAAHYGRVIALWGTGDAVVQPVVVRARAGHARTTDAPAPIAAR